MNRVIFHVDVNSAFLSWTAVYRKDFLGEDLDLRDIPSVIGGNEENRHGIVLAKSTYAKRCGIKTGEPLVSARQKCPELVTASPNYELYVRNSKALMRILRDYTPDVEQYSIDEAFMDMTGTAELWGNSVTAANRMKDEIFEKLGFTVNIGISSNKLLAKMAGELKKPNMVHTLYPEEIERKMWVLPVGKLFFVGRATQEKLERIGVRTIGDLANIPLNTLVSIMKTHGKVVYDFAHGVDISTIESVTPLNKGYSNSTTIPYDVIKLEQANKVILSLCETLASRFRNDGVKISTLSIGITDFEFHHYSHQMQLPSPTNVTNEIYHYACQLLFESWKEIPIRQLGVHGTKVTTESSRQYNIFTLDKYDRYEKLDKTIDSLRMRYGEDSIKRATFLIGEINHLSGGIDKAKRTGITKGV